MKRTDKESFVSALRERVDRAPAMYFTDFSGLNVKSMTALRRMLRDNGAEYMVAKNRLMLRALEGTEVPDLSEVLNGPTGIVFSYEDAVAPARALTDFAKEHNEKPVFKLGVLDNRILDAAQIDRLAKLPSREELLSELAGAMQAPMAALAMALEAKLQETAGLLDAYVAKKEEAGE
ncbi:MAG: 50S ribosomal protein L10 [Longimicrobiales bacterium]|nr:50S ribosomal protein L10 [Longimicrobiales bacterium]